jgi:heme exporter protein CcmD
VSGSGILEGGWEYVWAAYGISAVILIGYAVSLLLRYRDERRRDRRP